MSESIPGYKAVENILEYCEWQLSRVDDLEQRKQVRIVVAMKLRGGPTSESQQLAAARIEAVQLSRHETRDK